MNFRNESSKCVSDLTIADFYFWVVASYFDEIKIEDNQRWCAIWACSRNIHELFRLRLLQKIKLYKSIAGLAWLLMRIKILL